MLAPDVVLVSDGGGIVPMVRRPVEGADQVARLLARFAEGAPGARVDTVVLNGARAARIDLAGGATIAVSVAVSLAAQGGRISGIYAVANPEKLARLDTETVLAR